MNKQHLGIGLMVVCSGVTATAQIFFKMASSQLPEIIFNYSLWIGFFLYFLATVLLVLSFRWGEVTILFPILATSYIWVTLYAKYLFLEEIPFTRWIGVFFVIVGVSIMGIAGHKASAGVSGAKGGSGVEYEVTP